MPFKIKIEDLQKTTYGKLQVIKEVPNLSKTKGLKVLCRCSCGNATEVMASALKRKKGPRSCGCRQGSYTHGKNRTPLHKLWCSMKSRCNPKHKDTRVRASYTDRGITVCTEWIENFVNFETWALTNGYSTELSLDRKDNDKGYSPENCRWTTHHTQTVNQTKKKSNKTGYIGICLHKSANKYQANITVNKKVNYLGLFKTAELAVQARNNFITSNKLTEYKIQ